MLKNKYKIDITNHSVILCITLYMTIAILCYNLLFTIQSKPSDTLTALHSSSIPVRLVIPSVRVDAKIQSVGLTPTNNIDAPNNANDVAWFSLGAKPGEPGISIIDGHSGWLRGTPAVFDTLYTIEKGDKIYVTDSQAHTEVFVVQTFKNYKPNEHIPAIFDASDKKSHLYLITCSGGWDPLLKKHATRLIVFSDRLTD